MTIERNSHSHELGQLPAHEGAPIVGLLVEKAAWNTDAPVEDPAASDRPSPERSSYRTLVEQYTQICDALAICEAGHVRYGVPILIPTSRIRARRRKFESPAEDFLRLSLVGVSTKTLEMFCEDLDNLARNTEKPTLLTLPDLSPLERYGLMAPIGLALGLGVLGTLIDALGTNVWALGVNAIIAVFCGGLVAATSTDTYRRTTFGWLLISEIRRRRGLDSNGTSKLQICPTPNS